MLKPPTASHSKARNAQSQQSGQLAETIACAFLQGQGLALLTRNYRCRSGEIDLIMQQGETLVFIEVRYRQLSDYGSPLATITPAKQRKLRRAAQLYLQRMWGDQWPPCRFDAIGLQGDLNSAQPSIDWVQNAF